MKRAYFRACWWLLVSAAGASAQPAQLQLNTVPDFSQYHNAAWRNYCAPTSGADWVYHFANTYPALRQGNPVGPGAAANNGVDAIIGGNPPPAVGSLAQRMGTTLNGGTTLLGCANGLDSYLEANDGLAGNANWTTSLVLVANYPNPSALNFFNALQQTLAAGGGVILAIGWNNGNPGGYDIPDGYVPGDSAGSAMGHAVAMTGYNTLLAPPTVSINDPANNVGLPPPPHNWAGENLVLNVNGLPNGFVLNFGAFQGTVYGAVLVLPPIPAPGAGMVIALAGVVMSRRRR